MGDTELFLGNCLDVMNAIPSESIDLVVTDPPYRCISGGKAGKHNQPSGVLKKNDGKLFKHNDISPEEYMPELFRVLKETSQCYIFTNFINLKQMIIAAEDAGFIIHNLLVWEKNNATPSRWYMKNGEYVLFMRKGRAKPIANGGSKTVHKFKNITGNKLHPTEKPVQLMEFYIENSSCVGDIVLDPFMGAGSTGLACKSTNRRFIGIEIDKQYFDVARERIFNE